MPYITLNEEKLAHNYHFLNSLLNNNGIEWAVVTKLLCGHPEFLKAVFRLGIQQICDSRIGNLRTIKMLEPEIETVFIKPAAKRNVDKIVAYADVSFNTSLSIIKALSEAAVRQAKLHKVVIMVELGELREGVLPAALGNFYEQVFNLPNIEVVGLGANLACMYGVLPSYEKLKTLETYRDMLECRFDRKIPYLSGGASVTLPMIFRGDLPRSINHFRIGETLFFGTDVFEHGIIEGMHQDVFTLEAEIIELYEKPNIPVGDLGHNLSGEIKSFDATNLPKKSFRAIVDIGLLDIEAHHIIPLDKNIRIAGASSDMTVLDVGGNDAGFKVGDKLPFSINYMGGLRLMNSKYVDKRIEGSDRIKTFMQSPGVAAVA